MINYFKKKISSNKPPINKNISDNKLSIGDPNNESFINKQVLDEEQKDLSTRINLYFIELDNKLSVFNKELNKLDQTMKERFNEFKKEMKQQPENEKLKYLEKFEIMYNLCNYKGNEKKYGISHCPVELTYISRICAEHELYHRNNYNNNCMWCSIEIMKQTFPTSTETLDSQ